MNWGKGIAIFLTLFVLFILGLVYMTTQSTAELQAEDYYKQEIEYQDRIDALAIGRPYEESIELVWQDEQVVLKAEDEVAKVVDGGTIAFTRPNDASLDRQFSIAMSEGRSSFAKEEFEKGIYDVLILSETAKGALAIKKELRIP